MLKPLFPTGGRSLHALALGTAILLFAGCQRGTDSPQSDVPSQATTHGDSEKENKEKHSSNSKSAATKPSADNGATKFVGPARAATPPSTPPRTGRDASNEYLKLAIEAARQGKFKEADDNFSLAHNADETNKPVYLEYGDWLSKTGHIMKLAQLCGRGVQVLPDDPDLHNNFGVVHMRQGFPSNAKAEFEEAVRLNPRHINGLTNLAVVHFNAGHQDKAMELLQQAIDIRPDAVDAHYHMARVLMRERQYTEALKHLDELLRLRKDYSNAYALRAQANYALNRPDAAVADLFAASQAGPNDPDLQMTVARTLADYGNEQQAVVRLYKVLELRPDNADAHYLLARLLPSQGRLKQAVQHVRAALEARPDWPDANNLLAWLLATHRDELSADTSEAVTLAEEARQQADREAAEALDALAAAYAELGRYDEAVATAQAALDQARTLDAQPDNDLATAIAKRLELYRQGKPFREAWPPAATDDA